MALIGRLADHRVSPSKSGLERQRPLSINHFTLHVEGAEAELGVRIYEVAQFRRERIVGNGVLMDFR